MAITGLMEVILYVQDMAAQVTFYRDTLGLKLRFPTRARDLAGESWVTLDSGACVLMGDVRSPAPGVWVSDALDPEGNPLSIEEHRSAV